MTIRVAMHSHDVARLHMLAQRGHRAVHSTIVDLRDDHRVALLRYSDLLRGQQTFKDGALRVGDVVVGRGVDSFGGAYIDVVWAC